MVYALLKGAIKKYGRPVTTTEIEDHARENLPMCVDHVVQDLVTLEKTGLVTKSWSKERRGFVWQTTKDYSTREILEHPELYSDYLYYHAVVEEALRKHIDMEDAMTMLFNISGGSEEGSSLKEIRRKIREKYEMRTRWRWQWRDCWQGCDVWDRT